MNTKSLVLVGAVCAGVLLSTSALAAAPKDHIIVAGLQDSKGFTPQIQPNFNEYFYETTVPAGTPLADTIPIQFDLYTGDNHPGDTYSVTINAVGQVASWITFDATPFPMTDPQLGTLHYAYINTPPLAQGDFHANIQVNATPQSGVDITHATLHLLIHVINADTPPPPICYITDSSGLLLSDCAGNAVNNGGEFLVVSNQKKITSTNPGQFYYNFVWTNLTGSSVTFTSLGLNGVNVVSQGANSVHVLIYNSSSAVQFDDVNQTGTPCGTAGAVCKAPITVPDGQTLWLTWHVSYQWIGSTLWPDIPTAGPAGCGLSSPHGTITMSALLQNSDLSVSLGCSAGANGQKIAP